MIDVNDLKNSAFAGDISLLYENDWLYHSEKRNEKFILALSKNTEDAANRKWMLVLGETNYCCNQDNDGFNDLLTLRQFQVDFDELQELIKTSV